MEMDFKTMTAQERATDLIELLGQEKAIDMVNDVIGKYENDILYWKRVKGILNL